MWWLDEEVYNHMKNPECLDMSKALEKCKEINNLNDLKCNNISELFKKMCKIDHKRTKFKKGKKK